MFYTYILKSLVNNSLYVGFTNNVERRFEEHQAKKVFATKAKTPYQLLCYVACADSTTASNLEKYFKSGSGRAFVSKHINTIQK